jgi:hypothetical protein
MPERILSARAKNTNNTKQTRATPNETKMVVESFDINGTTIEANATNITRI